MLVIIATKTAYTHPNLPRTHTVYAVQDIVNASVLVAIAYILLAVVTHGILAFQRATYALVRSLELQIVDTRVATEKWKSAQHDVRQ
jgi:hypothetical protein